MRQRYFRAHQPRRVRGRSALTSPRTLVVIQLLYCLTGAATELPTAGAEPAAGRAPAHGSFVGISVTTSETDPLPMPRTTEATIPLPAFELVADGRSYPLAGLLDGAISNGNIVFGEHARHVADAGRATSLQLRVTFDGQSRTVALHGASSDAGRFASLDGAEPSAVVQLNKLRGGLALQDPTNPHEAIFSVEAGSTPAKLTVTELVHPRAAESAVATAPQRPVVPITWHGEVP